MKISLLCIIKTKGKAKIPHNEQIVALVAKLLQVDSYEDTRH